MINLYRIVEVGSSSGSGDRPRKRPRERREEESEESRQSEFSRVLRQGETPSPEVSPQRRDLHRERGDTEGGEGGAASQDEETVQLSHRAVDPADQQPTAPEGGREIRALLEAVNLSMKRSPQGYIRLHGRLTSASVEAVISPPEDSR